ncbi:Bifunctional protein FolD protein [Usitatibacter rugosus]|uniref:Bifunctional protein FolD n=1 Tax=Usitatibacter rugosus TaxID=2732067 RepID=A0A6M4GTW6_9PROT|nr:bifunctional methylenetetrahydrofolate dehydrogenase/methenyltetrahydrofolate cyclohydrolase FolD [Usitatibacter rugosus]QJR10789.1 Bifunctional protein FolD protein [Usitatibacter rugosus]
MTARILDGKAIAAEFRNECAVRVQRLKEEKGLVPGIAVVIVGDDPASKVYVRNKAQACEAIGMHSEVHPLPAETTQAHLLAFIHALNAAPAIHGILVQLPLPKHIDGQALIEAIDPAKDVDGFHQANLGGLITGHPAFYPCTPWGVMKLLEHTGIPIEGKSAVVIGRSNIVGKPMGLMLVHAGATTTICHRKTQDLAFHTRQADILVAAVGKAGLVTGDMLKPGAVVVDVGINRLANGKLAGDVDFETASQVASWITPVPGGVGPMTIAMLLGNTVKSAERAAGLGTGAETRIA